MNNTYIVLDIETTGNTNNELISYSAIECSHTDPTKIISVKTIEIMPNEEILPGATAVHGVSNYHINEMKEGAVECNRISQQEGLAQILKDFVKYYKEKTIIVGYNHITFDLSWIEHNILRYINKVSPESVKTIIQELKNNSIDVFELSKKFYTSTDFGDMKLSTVYIHECCKSKKDIDSFMNSRTIHAADIDCKITNELFRQLLKKLPEGTQTPLRDVIEFIKKPIMLKTIPYGKYKDQAFDVILEKDPSYLKWLLESNISKNTNPDLVYTIKQIIKSRNTDLIEDI